MSKNERRKQLGGAAVEFAFIFPVLFMLLYGTVVYAYVFIVHASMNFAAQEAAEAAVAVDIAEEGDDPAARAAIDARARATATQILAWLPEKQRELMLGDSGSKLNPKVIDIDAKSRGVEVTLTLPLKEPALFPVVTLPLGLGDVPNIPDNLVARAVARI